MYRTGNTETLEEKNCTEYEELQKHPSNAKKKDMLKKFHLNHIIPLYNQPSTNVYFHTYIGSYQWYQVKSYKE